FRPYGQAGREVRRRAEPARRRRRVSAAGRIRLDQWRDPRADRPLPRPEAKFMSDVLLAIDQGTSSSRAMAFSPAGEILASEQQPFEAIYPASGWVEHDAEVIWATVLSTTRAVLEQLRSQKAGPIAAVGITNQRETTV